VSNYTLLSNVSRPFPSQFYSDSNFFGFAAKAAIDSGIVRVLSNRTEPELGIESLNLLPGPSMRLASSLRGHSPIITYSATPLLTISVVVVALLLLQKVATEKREKVSRE
jgi:hypothetical protein